MIKAAKKVIADVRIIQMVRSDTGTLFDDDVVFDVGVAVGKDEVVESVGGKL